MGKYRKQKQHVRKYKKHSRVVNRGVYYPVRRKSQIKPRKRRVSSWSAAATSALSNPTVQQLGASAISEVSKGRLNKKAAREEAHALNRLGALTANYELRMKRLKDKPRRAESLTKRYWREREKWDQKIKSAQARRQAANMGDTIASALTNIQRDALAAEREERARERHQYDIAGRAANLKKKQMGLQQMERNLEKQREDQFKRERERQNIFKKYDKFDTKSDDGIYL